MYFYKVYLFSIVMKKVQLRLAMLTEVKGFLLHELNSGEEPSFSKTLSFLKIHAGF